MSEQASSCPGPDEQNSLAPAGSGQLRTAPSSPHATYLSNGSAGSAPRMPAPRPGAAPWPSYEKKRGEARARRQAIEDAAQRAWWDPLTTVEAERKAEMERQLAPETTCPPAT